MKIFKNYKKIALVATLLTLTIQITQAKDYILNTASTGGTYHPVGTAISTLSKIKLLPKYKFSLTAVNSAGSGANVQALGSKTADFAILQGLYGLYALNGTGPVTEPQKNIRSITMLWEDIEHFIVPVDKVKTGNISDLVALKGKTAGMGKENSGALGSNELILSGIGIDIYKDYQLVYGGYGPTLDAMANGQVMVSSIPSGMLTSSITKLMASNKGKFVILDITNEQRIKIDAGRKLWRNYKIKAGSYPGQDKDVNTMSQPNFLAVNDNVDEEHVYRLTKSIYENLSFLQAIHPATKEMAIEKAIAGLPVPLHPGAKRYYKEIGLKIPSHLE